MSGSEGRRNLLKFENMLDKNLNPSVLTPNHTLLIWFNVSSAEKKKGTSLLGMEFI